MKNIISSMLGTFFMLVTMIPTATAYVIAGNDSIVASNSTLWSWDGSYHAPLRSALADTSNFGVGGIVNETVSTINLGTNITNTSLASVDLFVSSWWQESQSAAYHSTILNYFSSGGDLMLLQDSGDRDGIGSLLGISTIAGSVNPTTVTSPLLNGPFGTVNPVNQGGTIGTLDTSAILALGGTVCGTNGAGAVTMACWGEGAFSAGSGSLTIFADVDLISSTSNDGASFSPLNDKGRLALNTVNFHISSVPIPASIWLFLTGLFGLISASKRKAH